MDVNPEDHVGKVVQVIGETRLVRGRGLNIASGGGIGGESSQNWSNYERAGSLSARIYSS